MSDTIKRQPFTTRDIEYHVKTLHLFTKADYVTLFFPVTLFAAVVGPIPSFDRLIQAAFWVWIHLLQCNVSNQVTGVVGDRIDKPWRPIPAGRLTLEQATRLRWSLLYICLAFSAYHGATISSCAIALYIALYDQLGMHYHWLPKQFCNTLAYFFFQLGGAQVASGKPLDNVSIIAAASVALVIVTTIHAADFPDVEGDTKQGRKTVPILWPVGSRIVMCFTLILWSVFFSVVWGTGALGTTFIILLGAAVGWRFVYLTTQEDDWFSYVFYNIWLISLHILPVNARLTKLAWI